ncbi:MAG: TPR end-of-group domain-containing protein [Planctomycetota bacterium]
MLVGAHYNLACLLSLASVPGEEPKEPAEDPAALQEKALAHLGKALELGWKDLDHIAKDTDLDPVRKLPAFQALMEKWKAKGEKKE